MALESSESEGKDHLLPIIALPTTTSPAPNPGEGSVSRRQGAALWAATEWWSCRQPFLPRARGTRLLGPMDRAALVTNTHIIVFIFIKEHSKHLLRA